MSSIACFHNRLLRRQAEQTGLSLLAVSIMVVFCFLSSAPVPAYAQTTTPEAPPGFQLVSSGEGVWLFRKDYPNGTPDYVQVVDLSQQAGILLMYANIIEPRPGRGVYGGDDPRFSLQPLSMFWDEALMQDQKTYCVSNGSFFYMLETPTRLAFPLKVDGKYITDGFGILTYPGQKLMLELWTDHADIQELSRQSLYESSAPDILGGLKEDANKRAKFAVGRTFVGIADNDRNGRFETVLFLNTSTAVQAEAAQVLKDFNAEKVMMLDGGGSTQLICEGNDIISSDRLIPQALAVVEGGPHPISGRSSQELLWLVVHEKQEIPVKINLTNDGMDAWIPGTHTLIVEDPSQKKESQIPLHQTIMPGDEISFDIALKGYEHAGLYQARLYWYIAQGDRRFAGDPIELRIAVLAPTGTPAELESEAQIVATGVNTSVATSKAPQTEAPTPEVEAAAPGSPQQLSLRNLLWVPAVVLPLGIAILVLIRRGRV